MFEIICEPTGGKRLTHVSNKPHCTIGSGSGNDIVIDNKTVSRKHAAIKFDGKSLSISDLGSMSGTWVNDERIVVHGPISSSDEIMIGQCRLWIRAAGSKESASLRENIEPTEAKKKSVHLAAAPVANPAFGGPTTGSIKKSDVDTMHWRQYLHDEILGEMDLRRKDVHRMADEELRRETESIIDSVLARKRSEIPKLINLGKLKQDVLDEAVGLGPLERLLADDAVTEIMVNNHKEIFVERAGKLDLSETVFTNDLAVLRVIERIITPLGRRIDESSPMVDARLKDGSRVNAIIPPLAIRGPCITIRKFSKKRLQFENLIEFGSISPDMVDFLKVCVVHRKNIIVSGGTGSGKTTLLNVLSNLIPKDERVVTAEDAAELQLNQPNLVSLESRPSNLEGKGQISIRDLVRNALRMRPDRIVVGECRGGEALDMLQAMNTGHDGSLTTAHANSPRDMLSRMEVMVLMAGMDLPITAIREQIASAVHLIVQQTRFACGSRKVTYVTEIVGMESGKIQLQDIFLFRATGYSEQGKVRGHYEACGFIPTFYEELSRSGLKLDLSIFEKNRKLGQ